jgi:hypothetical protein
MTERTNSSARDYQQAGQTKQEGQITIMADYFSLANEIIQPDQYVSTTRYFCLKWEPSLGLVGARIIRVLRSLGYYNRQTGEMRDGIPIDLPELAALCGFSVATIKREFGSGKDGKPANPSLHTFVQREKNYKHDAVTGQIWREENIYRVKMDDPVHPDDLPRLQELWESRQKGGKGKDAKVDASKQRDSKTAKSPSGVSSDRKAQNEPNGGSAHKAQSEPYGKARRAHIASDESQVESNSVQLDSDSSQVESNSVQYEPALIDYSCPPEKPLNSSSDASEFSLSLFEESEQKRPDQKRSAPRIWAELTEGEQKPYLDRARTELESVSAGMGINPQIVEVRGKNLYHLANKS